ncbi:PPE domain-containing protein [Actinokineospora sp. NBRC 105648]|uniref:PPE domain-containing protein n=1 Tax=Actinokineospora sp. NBRC 105648 TaxID=3032206 RepID=UPI0024A3A879|nr:PPE domain-containing protein [Actinokineospora sp. NBRC 105648]GLZ42498.1 hypothetical protein Acsp05_61220 [Actinokineospora sp. NBRC 105648]
MTRPGWRHVPRPNVNYQAHDHDALKAMTDPADVGTAQKVADEWKNLGAELRQAGIAIQEAVVGSEASWTGPAGDAMRSRLREVAEWSVQSGKHFSAASTAISGQVDAAEFAQTTMPKPVPYDPGQMYRDAFPNPFKMVALTWEIPQRYAEHTAAHQEAVRVVERRDLLMTASAAAVPAFSAPPELPDGTTEPPDRDSVEGRGQWGVTNSHGGRDGYPRPSTKPGDQVGGSSDRTGGGGRDGGSGGSERPGPTGTQPPGGGPGGPSGPGNPGRPGNPGGPDAGTNPDRFAPPSGGGLPTGPDLVNGVRPGPVDASTGGHPNGLSGGFTPGGYDPGAAARSGGLSGRGGAGGGASGGAGGAHGSGERGGAARTGVGTPAAEAAAGRAGSGPAGGRSGAMGMGGAGAGTRGQGEEDDEHTRAAYLLEADPDSIFGTDERTVPPVIGG